MAYTRSITIADASFDDVVDRTEAALGEEDFGVITEVDVRATFQEKLDEDIGEYRILGACNPGKAYEGIQQDAELGALLPCNVVVYETDEGITVSVVDPEALLGVADDPAFDSLAAEVSESFDRVLETLAD